MQGHLSAHRPPREQVVIVGGGFGGLYTALALAAVPGHPPVLLVEPAERFLFLPLLYELLSGELRGWEIAPRYDELLAGRGVAWLQDRAVTIDLEERTVRTAGGRSLGYTRLVLATGGRSDHFGVAGAERHSLGFRTLADLERLQGLLMELRRNRRPLQRLAIVGAGPTGVELACKVADLLEGSAVVELIEQGPELLGRSRAFNREQAERALRLRDVRVRTRTRVIAVEADHLRLHQEGEAASPGPESLPVNGVIWTAGLRFTPPVMRPEPPADSRGRLLCQSDLRLRGWDDVFVVGDLAADLPATAQVAFQQAPVVAANLLRSLAGEPLEPFVWKDLGEIISLGIGDASLVGSGVTLSGPAAFQVRRLAYLTRLPGLPLRMRVAASWLTEVTP